MHSSNNRNKQTAGYLHTAHVYTDKLNKPLRLNYMLHAFLNPQTSTLIQDRSGHWYNVRGDRSFVYSQRLLWLWLQLSAARRTGTVL